MVAAIQISYVDATAVLRLWQDMRLLSFSSLAMHSASVVGLLVAANERYDRAIPFGCNGAQHYPVG
jgi:hypothetical protein